VVISVDPRRIYVSDASDAPQYRCVALREGNRGPNGETLCWYQCTVKGGREGRPLDVFQVCVLPISIFSECWVLQCSDSFIACFSQLAKACEALGAGELLVNSIDADGSKRGFDVDLLGALSSSCGLPVIASSGAGCVEHFSSVFRETRCEAALAAGIFHRNEVSIGEVKAHLKASDIAARD
jgi:glutamine amidotransferase/cyclase